MLATQVAHGNTSACAEKSRVAQQFPPAFRKYLRVRGEEATSAEALETAREIPPRARRRVSLPSGCTKIWGNTSACAEKRCPRYGVLLTLGKYLRVRGEETRGPEWESFTKEIPPRARRRDR